MSLRAQRGSLRDERVFRLQEKLFELLRTKLDEHSREQ